MLLAHSACWLPLSNIFATPPPDLLFRFLTMTRVAEGLERSLEKPGWIATMRFNMVTVCGWGVDVRAQTFSAPGFFRKLTRSNVFPKPCVIEALPLPMLIIGLPGSALVLLTVPMINQVRTSTIRTRFLRSTWHHLSFGSAGSSTCWLSASGCHSLGFQHGTISAFLNCSISIWMPVIRSAILCA